MLNKAQLLRDIFAENRRIEEAFDKGTREVPVIVDPKKLKAIESHAARHMHDQSGKCIKNVWWKEEGFCENL